MKKAHFLLYIFFIGMSCSKSDSIAPTPAQPSTPPPVLEIGDFSLELPENNKNCETGTTNLDKADVEFKWKAAKNATKYEIQITDLFDAKVSSIIDITGTSKTISLTRGRSFSWNMIATNPGSKSVTSASWKFYLSGDGKINRAPTSAKAIYPVPGSTINLNANGNVKFEWLSEDPDKDILTYSIRIDTLNNNQKFVGSSFDSKSPVKEIKLEIGKIYYWYVTSNDGAISVKSDIFSFKLK
ncbi:MAG: hypothetical protein RL567_610 [Bacteroidota bacterium]|jgi:hypothetical protein